MRSDVNRVNYLPAVAFADARNQTTAVILSPAVRESNWNTSSSLHRQYIVFGTLSGVC